MGQIMGSFPARNVDLYMDDKPTFDPQAGFNYQRKSREMIAKPEELESARIPPEYRDYCSHLLLSYHQCRYKNMPMLYKCAHEKHDYLNCQHQEDPTPASEEEIPVKWKPSTKDTFNFLYIDEHLQLGPQPDSERHKLWKDLYRRYRKNITNKLR